jgi:hypothetical protein
MDILSQIPGALIVFIALGDIYLTVLQGGSVSWVSGRLNRVVWRLFRGAAAILPRNRSRLLSYAGPTLVALNLITWVMLLVIGFALIFLPALGTQIVTSQGETPTGLWTAIYFSAMSISTLGAGDIVATTAPYRLLEVLGALIGFSVLTASLTYLMSIYSGLIRNNAFALSLHHASTDTGNSTELVARLGPGGDFSGGQQELSTIGMELVTLIKSHHIYVVLRYFRLASTAYALPRFAFLTIDSASLVRSAIDQERYRTIVRSTSVARLWHGGLQLVTGIGGTFLPDGLVDKHTPDEHDEQEWRGHFRRAVNRFHNEDIAIAQDLQAAEDEYVALRRKWQAHISALTDYLQYEWTEICPDEQKG